MRITLILLLLFAISNLLATKVKIDSTFTYSVEISISEAKSISKQKIRYAAIEKALPVDVVVSGIMNNYESSNDEDSFSKNIFVQTGAAGLIIEENYYIDNIIADGDFFHHRLAVIAKVIDKKTERDPDLDVEINLNETFFRDGDYLKISAQPSHNGYLYLFYFMADETVMLMYPNSMSENNFIEAGENVDLTEGYEFQLHAMPDRKTTYETIYAVFSRSKINDINEFAMLQEGDPVMTAGEESYTLFQKWLSKVPVNIRKEKAKQIQIERN
jgi:hypothetical protein